MHPKNLKIFRGETLFVIPVNLTLETVNLKGYIIYSPRKEEEIRERFSEDVNLILENLNDKPIYKWVNPAEAVADVAGKYEPFLQWRVQNNRILVDVKKKALGKYLKNSGISVIISGDPDTSGIPALNGSRNEQNLKISSLHLLKIFKYSHFLLIVKLCETERSLLHLSPM